MSDSVQPHRQQPTRLSCPWDSPGKNTGVGCHFLLQMHESEKWKVKVKSLSRVQLPAIPWTAAYQAPLSMGFSSQEYWSGVPLPSPLDSWVTVWSSFLRKDSWEQYSLNSCMYFFSTVTNGTIYSKKGRVNAWFFFSTCQVSNNLLPLWYHPKLVI